MIKHAQKGFWEITCQCHRSPYVIETTVTNTPADSSSINYS